MGGKVGGDQKHGPTILFFSMMLCRYQLLIRSKSNAENGGHLYVFPSLSRTWNAAEAWCKGKSAHLASVDNGQENTSINNSAPPEQKIWIGYNDKQNEGSWVWSDGSAAGYNNWQGGEPNDSGDAEDCAQMYDSGLWSDSNCGSSLPFVCERGGGDADKDGALSILSSPMT